MKGATDKYEERYGVITSDTLRDNVCNTHNVFDIKRNVTVSYTYSSGWYTRTKNFTYNAWYSTDKMAKAIIDYIVEEFAKEKDLDEVHLHVQTANHESREFYSRRGYGFISEEEKRILLGKKIK